MSTLIGRWESRNGAYMVELHKAEGGGYCYRGVNISGYMGNNISEAQAIAYIEERCQGGGIFQPDANKLPMKRVK